MNNNNNEKVEKYHTKEATWIQDKQKLSSNLTLYEAYTNHWTSKLRRAETKRKKEFNPEVGKRRPQTQCLKRKKAEKYYINEGTN